MIPGKGFKKIHNFSRESVNFCVVREGIFAGWKYG
jgi:hypothetical protein